MAEADLSNFTELREKYVHAIAQNLSEAHSLMIKLNSNLRIRVESTGEVDHLAAVWATFQRKMASLSTVLGLMEGESPQTQAESMGNTCFHAQIQEPH
ncbi:hypothetical protein MATL_G00166320 [Megalops atlanticus]|uniref:Uncharacterized protein n=1 Tax=Megalops atlanticus TaxID=7932 RepID=A0A9D3T7M1_MEGAT|nr:hypothetical protein MATL_G00166320 [Megalops atlanticus]